MDVRVLAGDERRARARLGREAAARMPAPFGGGAAPCDIAESGRAFARPAPATAAGDVAAASAAARLARGGRSAIAAAPG